MILTTLFVAVTCYVTSSTAFIVFSTGTCPEIPVQNNFDLTRYQGRWYSYEDFDVPYQFLTTCVSAEYALKANGNIRVINRGERKFSLFGQTLFRSPVEIEGEARVVDPALPAALQVAFGGMPTSGDNKPNYLILSTDYDNYSLVYSCFQPLGDLPFRVDSAWILTRERGVRPDATNALKLTLQRYGVNTNNFKLVDHDDCRI